MLESIAMWGGIAGIFVSVFAIILLYFIKKQISDILNKDAILFDNNFEIKHSAILDSLNLIDELQQNNSIKSNAEFIERAKKCHNNLLCVITEVKIADEFFEITLEPNSNISEARILLFKLMCRSDIGLKIKKSQLIDSVKDKIDTTPKEQPYQQPIKQEYQPQQYQPVQQEYQAQQYQPAQQEYQPQQYQQPVEPEQTQAQAMINTSQEDDLFGAAPQQEVPARPMQPQRPMVQRPAQRPMPQRPVQRPVQPRPNQPTRPGNPANR